MNKKIRVGDRYEVIKELYVVPYDSGRLAPNDRTELLPIGSVLIVTKIFRNAGDVEVGPHCHASMRAFGKAESTHFAIGATYIQRKNVAPRGSKKYLKEISGFGLAEHLKDLIR